MKKIFFTLLFILNGLYAQNILLMTEIFPPFQFEKDGKAMGIGIEIVRSIEKELGLHDKIKIYPWKRGVKIVDNKKNSALFSMLKTKERSPRYKWVGPITSMKLVFFKKKGSLITLKTLNDAKQVGKIGVAKKVANYEMLKAKGFTNLVPIKRGVDEQNLKLLAYGRIDLWPTLLKAGIYNAKLMRLLDKVEPIRNVVAFQGDMYIAFNKNTDDSIVNRWQKALDRLKKNHTIDQILQQYNQ